MNRARMAFFAPVLALLCAGQLLAADLSVAQRVQRLKDREAIRAVLIEYARLLDNQDFVGYSKLFATQGVWEGNIGSAKGPAEIRKMLDVTFARIPPGNEHKGSYHVLSNVLIDVNGDTAKSWSRWTWFVPGPQATAVGQRSGHYEDTLIRENGQWKFQHRLTVTELPTAQNDKETAVWRSDYRTPAAPTPPR
jgi:hypothetical protein